MTGDNKTVINNWTGGGTLQTWPDGEWQILYAKDASGNAVTLSLTSQDAARLAYAVSPIPGEQFDRMRAANQAVYELSYPEARADELRQIADEIECDGGCEGCSPQKQERGEFCGFVAADNLRKLASALDVKAKIDAALSPKIAAAETSPGDVVAMKEACKRVALEAKAREVEIFDAANRDQALSVTGRQAIQDRALARDSIARDIAAAIDRLDVKAEAKSQEPEAVAIKPLEWTWEPPYSVARALGGHYSVERWDRSQVDLLGSFIKMRQQFTTVDAAKAAAQADYEQRIRSALIHPTTKPAVSVDAVALLIFNDRLKRRGLSPVTMEAVRRVDIIDILAIDRPTATAIAALITGIHS